MTTTTSERIYSLSPSMIRNLARAILENRRDEKKAAHPSIRIANHTVKTVAKGIAKQYDYRYPDDKDLGKVRRALNWLAENSPNVHRYYKTGGKAHRYAFESSEDLKAQAQKKAELARRKDLAETLVGYLKSQGVMASRDRYKRDLVQVDPDDLYEFLKKHVEPDSI